MVYAVTRFYAATRLYTATKFYAVTMSYAVTKSYAASKFYAVNLPNTDEVEVVVLVSTMTWSAGSLLATFFLTTFLLTLITPFSTMRATPT